MLDYESMSEDEILIRTGEMLGWKRVPFKQAKDYDETVSDHRHYLCWVDEKGMFKFFFKYHDCDLRCDEVWNPLTNSNHTDMLRDKLVELGLSTTTKLRGDGFYEIYVFDIVNGITVHIASGRTHHKKEINKTITQAFVEAIRKLKEVGK